MLVRSVFPNEYLLDEGAYIGLIRRQVISVLLCQENGLRRRCLSIREPFDESVDFFRFVRILTFIPLLRHTLSDNGAMVYIQQFSGVSIRLNAEWDTRLLKLLAETEQWVIVKDLRSIQI